MKLIRIGVVIMKSYKKLVGNSFIFAIGRLGSQALSFILVPVYTYYLSTAEFGSVDLVVTTSNMLIPIVSASIFDAVFRYTLEDVKKKDSILINSLFISIIGFCISIIFFPIIYYIDIISDLSFVFFMYCILFVLIIERILAEFARAIGEIKIFAINGILLAFSTGILNILFIVFLSLGVLGYFLAMIFANAISIAYLLYSTKPYKNFDFNLIKTPVIKVLLAYSIPLIPNALMWWLINASSRYFIAFYLSVNDNGLFAVASRIPTLITIVTQIFMQAWQLSAIEEYATDDTDSFYSNVFNFLASFLFLGTSAILILLKPMFNLLFSADYYSGWLTVPFLLLSAVFSSFSGFLGTNYIAAKKTGGVFKTSVYGGIISIILNFVLISRFGLIGAGLSSMISFLVMWLLRLYDTKNLVGMDTDWKLIIGNLVVIFFHILILNIGLSVRFELIIGVLLFLSLLLINKRLMILLINLIMHKS